MRISDWSSDVCSSDLPSTPLTTLRLGELIKDVVPAGVVNILSGGNEAGAHLVSHADVAKVTFTGSTDTGRAIMGAVAPTLKRLTLELGGNDAAIVLPDDRKSTRLNSSH